MFGASGAGKSTLTTALHEPESLRGAGFAVRAGRRWWRAAVGIVPQRGALFDHLSAADNIALALRNAEPPATADERGGAAWIERVDLPAAWSERGTRWRTSAAGRRSGWRSRGRWRAGARSCCSTSRRSGSTRTGCAAGGDAARADRRGRGGGAGGDARPRVRGGVRGPVLVHGPAGARGRSSWRCRRGRTGRGRARWRRRSASAWPERQVMRLGQATGWRARVLRGLGAWLAPFVTAARCWRRCRRRCGGRGTCWRWRG
jgi:hypothetical protein